jgi:hypothetical protein
MADQISSCEYEPEIFSTSLIQALSDWQRGEGASKAALALALKDEALKLPTDFRATTGTFYRRIDIDPANLMVIGTKFKLPETISSWTKDYSVAKHFKELPKTGYRGSIFSLVPTKGVILDIDRLFSTKAFRTRLFQIQGQIIGLKEGIHRYANSEKEVLIECSDISADSLYALGGYTKDKDYYLNLQYGPNPTDQQRHQFEQAMLKGNQRIGPYWLNDKETIARLTKKLTDNAARLTGAAEGKP